VHEYIQKTTVFFFRFVLFFSSLHVLDLLVTSYSGLLAYIT